MSVEYLSFGVPLINSAKEDTRRLVDAEKIGYNFHSESLEFIISKLSKISLDEIDIMKKKSHNFFKNRLSEKSYYFDMESVMNRVNSNEVL